MPEQDWLLGCLLCAVGSFFSSFGLVLQKHAFNIGEGEKHLCLRWRWWSGWFMAVCVAGLMESFALVLAPLSLIAPMFGLSVAANSLVSACALGERLNMSGVGALAVMVIGTSLTSALGPHDNAHYSEDALVDLLTGWNAALYFMGMTVVCGVSMLALSFKNPPWLESLLYANLAGCTGGNQTLFLKCTMIVITNAMKFTGYGETDVEGSGVIRWETLEQVTPYVMVGMTVLLGIAQLISLNEGLARHSAITYLAAYKSILTTYGCVAGGVCFKEFYSLSVWQLVAFPCSVVIVIIGLVGLTKSDEANTEATEKQLDESSGLLPKEGA